ncbi:hypothetical protein RJ639_019366 [Escallonia herrerae]|uniref:Prolyl endopeptidase-like n=1 Tax=Escallonia herrerae TaxID=1293975 RepID=A0AA88V6J2_9ASTE|nr:hypothetical protein RJ639_019366 [Escallonia herrerae]
MRHFRSALWNYHRRPTPTPSLRSAHYKSQPPPPPPPPPPSPPTPPKPPKKPQAFTLHDQTWEDPYSWMSRLKDKVAMRHMDVYMEQEEKYTEAVMSGTERLQSKLQLYYLRVEEGKQYPVICRRLASLNNEFISHKSPSGGFDFTSGKRIEQKLLDYNQEAERFGGYAYEELSEVSPDHRFLAYTMYDKDNDYFKLSVRDMNFGSLCSKPHADRVSNLAWAKDGQALLYVVTDHHKRPYRIYCSMLGSSERDTLLFEEPKENVHVRIRHKGFPVFLINAADPLSGMTLVWECEAQAHCIVEHHQGYLYLFTDAARDGQPVDYHYLLHCLVDSAFSPRQWENILVDGQELIVEDVDFSDSHLGAAHLKDLNPYFLPLPSSVTRIFPGPNYDYYSSIMRFTISSPVMPDAVVDYDLSTKKWNIIQQQNMLHERTRVLYGSAASPSSPENPSISRTSGPVNQLNFEEGNLWNDLTEFYACEHYDVLSNDGVRVPLTLVYSRKRMTKAENPGLLHGHGAYGELLDKRWRSELKSLLDHGWVVAFADWSWLHFNGVDLDGLILRGGGGGGKRWHQNGRGTEKQNSINDYISCAKFLIEREIVQQNKLAGWGYLAGGLLVASAINCCPSLFRATVLKVLFSASMVPYEGVIFVPFLDPSNTLVYPILPLTPVYYEEFGYTGDIMDFQAIRKYCPYENIQKDILYPAVLVTSFGVWESAKWVARVRERTIYHPERPILLNLTTDVVEENRYLQCKELALETAFLLKMVDS